MDIYQTFHVVQEYFNSNPPEIFLGGPALCLGIGLWSYLEEKLGKSVKSKTKRSKIEKISLSELEHINEQMTEKTRDYVGNSSLP